jgi:histidine triad (HIT) family protein
VYRDSLVTAFIASHWWPRKAGAVVIAVDEHFENLYALPEEYCAAVGKVSKRREIA